MVLPANGWSCVRRLSERGGVEGSNKNIMICRTAYVIVYYYYHI